MRAGEPRGADARRERGVHDTLGEVLHRPTVLPTPLFPLKLVYGSELVESLLLVSQRVTPTRLEASGYTFLHPTLEAGLRAVLRR